MYSPFNAILLSVFPPLGLAASIAVWGVLEALAIAAYILLFRRLVPAGLPVQLLFVTLVLSSFPILHNVAWGQVGIFTTVAILAVLSLYEQRRLVAAAAALAFAVSFKFFPLIFLAPFADRRDTRFLMLAVLACGACLLLIPGVVLGFGDTLRFYAALFDSYRDMTWVVGNYNSQHFPHVALRLARAAKHDWSPYLPLLRAISYGIAAANLGLVFLVQKRRLPHADLFSFHVLFLTIPFVMNTSWPSTLPTSLSPNPSSPGESLRRPEAPGASDTGVSPGANGSPSRTHRVRKAVTILLLLLSITVSNVVFFNMVGDRFRYGFLGFQFWANLLLLVATYAVLIPSSQGRMSTRQPPNNSWELTRRAVCSAELESPASRESSLVGLPASAAQLSSRPLGDACAETAQTLALPPLSGRFFTGENPYTAPATITSGPGHHDQPGRRLHLGREPRNSSLNL